MTLDEARQAIGLKVVYEVQQGDDMLREEGVVTSVNERYVFVCYGAEVGSKATPPDALTLVARPAWMKEQPETPGAGVRAERSEGEFERKRSALHGPF